MTSASGAEVADRYCRELANRHYENFSVASVVLPPRLRLHLARIYAFCRTTDDFGDEIATCVRTTGTISRTSPEAALARLVAWREQVEACFRSPSQAIHPVLIALAQTVEGLEMSPEPFLDLIDANIQDQRVASYETWEELRRYCMLSAAPVGRMVLTVFGVTDPRAVPLSDDVCNGLQLANFAQDVAVDRAKGRTYLLQSELREHGLLGAVRSMCTRASELLASGLELEEMVPGRLRIQLALYRLGGNAILSAIRRTGYRTDLHRPHVSRREKLWLIPVAVMQTRRAKHQGGRRMGRTDRDGAAAMDLEP